VRLSPSVTLALDSPIPSRAIRSTLTFTADGRPNQLTYVYAPDDGQTVALPTLLVVYPGPADQWESVSLPLAQAGYAVIAVGPDYALDLEPDIDDLERVLGLIRAGRIPRADGTRVGALGGSYSGLHVLRLAIRDPQALRAALLLGPPADLFELRREYEAGTFFPPFGLDQALIALGLPSEGPERYWRYSARFHAAAIPIPLMLIHSREDEVVPFRQSELLAAELARLGKPHELHILDGMGHYLLATERTPAIDDLFKTTTDFFARYLTASQP
jgi:dipeptidyl aminopeptidase/acylaminoacyl peptidase